MNSSLKEKLDTFFDYNYFEYKIIKKLNGKENKDLDNIYLKSSDLFYDSLDTVLEIYDLIGDDKNG